MKKFLKILIILFAVLFAIGIVAFIAFSIDRLQYVPRSNKSKKYGTKSCRNSFCRTVMSLLIKSHFHLKMLLLQLKTIVLKNMEQLILFPFVELFLEIFLNLI